MRAKSNRYTSIESKKRYKICHCNRDEPDGKHLPAPKSDPGPPFAVGQVILCNVPDHVHGGVPFTSSIERGFRYKIRLERGTTVWTNMTESWLQPRWAPGQFTPDQDDPFDDLRSDQSLKFGSYGIHVDAQLDSLDKIVQSKIKYFAVPKGEDDIRLVYDATANCLN